MYETVYSSTAAITVLFTLAGAFIAAWSVLSIYWNLREISRGRGRAQSQR